MRLQYIFSRITRLFTKRPITGGRKEFIVDRIKLRRKPKIITKIGRWGHVEAEGAHGQAFDLVIYKGLHKTGLVVKKYYDCEKQTKYAEKEFAVFKMLKEKGYPVPPTVRLVEIRGKKYVILTDLSKFGNIQTDSLYDAQLYLGKEAGGKLADYVKQQEDRAMADEKLRNIAKLWDWEVVIDRKTKKAKAFILDLGQYTRE